MFSAISGSDAAGAAAVGRMTIDRLVESGYPRPYACALVAAGACTGILIPPSIAYIIIGLVLGISASTLFVAAVIPGSLILLSILITNIVVNRIYGYEGGGNVGFGEYFANLGRALASGWYAFIVPGVIFYGIFSGQLTPTEAGATAVIVTVILGFILGTLKLADFPAMLISSAKVNGVILPIIAFSLPLAQALAIMGVPQGFVTAVTGLTDDPTTLILLMILILIAAGCVMETTPNIVILAPILHHDDHRAGGGIHHAAAWPQPLCRVGHHRRIHPADRVASGALRLFHADRGAADCLCPGDFDHDAPRCLQIGPSHDP
jgi:tripartite ATP-independent transporter DctM subunit